MPSQAALEAYLPNNGEAAVFVDFLTRVVGVDVSQLPFVGASVPEGQLLERLDELVATLTVMLRPASGARSGSLVASQLSRVATLIGTSDDAIVSGVRGRRRVWWPQGGAHVVMLTFEPGATYSRADIKERAGLGRDAKGGRGTRVLLSMVASS